ncbi:DUF192 domain-containing protein [Salinibacter altiplanensis]|uniref:DUF192 domain-containing protein n=1 Tax=Salinibacter altiplanensis TaxID=1803181 RepID=UPI000C9FDB9A|nr:DUF192 domain-containing protein [Salinibacter altiplanensis]
MNGFTTYLAAAFVLLLLIAVIIVVRSGHLGKSSFIDQLTYEWKTVELVDASGKRLAEVDARIANTPKKQYIGLSRTKFLGSREGMLFIHDSMDTQVYVMRQMDFPLDILFIAPDGGITTIHQAECSSGEPPDSDLPRFHGEGKYVLELSLGTASEVGLDETGRVVIPDSTES